MISAIIPTLNDAARLPRALAPLLEGMTQGLVKQVIVADAGSRDGTLRLARAARCDIVKSGPGRAKQLRAGATSARGKWLLFLNPDTALGGGWVEDTRRFIDASQSRKRAAVFRLAFDDARPETRQIIFWERLRARVMKLPHSDQGLLISRFFYDGLGGYPDAAEMDHVEFIRRIGRSRLIQLRAEAITSSEKYQREAGRRGWRDVTQIARYLMGADLVELAKAYK